MSLLDLIRGDWTWWMLFKETAPVLALAVAAFFAGYERGWNRGFQRAAGLLEQIETLAGRPPEAR